MDQSLNEKTTQTTTEVSSAVTQSEEPSEKSSIVEVDKGGRPTKFTDETVANLIKAFEDGASIREACRVAKINRQTYYEWLKHYPEFSDRMSEAQEYPDVVAKMVLVRAIKKGDIDTSKWWAERKMKNEFSLRTELTGKDGDRLIPRPLLDGINKSSDNADNNPG